MVHHMLLCTVHSHFQLVRAILAAPTISPSFVCLCVLCGCVGVWPCLQEFMDDGCCEIQWRPKWKSNCSANVCIWVKIGLVLRARAWIHTFYLYTNGSFHRTFNWTYCEHMEKHNNVNIYTCTVSLPYTHLHMLTYTHMQLSRPPGVL